METIMPGKKSEKDEFIDEFQGENHEREERHNSPDGKNTILSVRVDNRVYVRQRRHVVILCMARGRERQSGRGLATRRDWGRDLRLGIFSLEAI
jgi:hypothetical protein